MVHHGGLGVFLVFSVDDQAGHLGAQRVQPGGAVAAELALGHQRPLLVDHEADVVAQARLHLGGGGAGSSLAAQ